MKPSDLLQNWDEVMKDSPCRDCRKMGVLKMVLRDRTGAVMIGKEGATMACTAGVQAPFPDIRVCMVKVNLGLHPEISAKDWNQGILPLDF